MVFGICGNAYILGLSRSIRKTTPRSIPSPYSQNGNILHNRPFSSRELLRRNRVAVMFQFGAGDRVASLDVCFALGIYHKVDRLGDAPGENDASLLRSIEKVCRVGAGSLVSHGGSVAEFMDSTVHIGIFMGSKFRHAINENLRFLNACPIIQINPRSSSDIDIQTGKPGTPFIHVKRWKRWRVRR